MKNMSKELNEFFVKCFNDILREEEKVLAQIANGRISVKEVHLIEAIYKAKQQGDTTLGNISKILGVSQGTLTVAVTVLEKKGYVVRVQNPNDRRSYSLSCTKLGEYINEEHIKFHNDMVASVIDHLNEKELEALAKGLDRLHVFFKAKK